MKLIHAFLVVSAVAMAGLPSLAKADDQGTATQATKIKKKKPATASTAADQGTGHLYGVAGCGLGSMVFGDQQGFNQVWAATLNGTSGNQTFGISTGTLNCDQQSGAHRHTAMAFIFANREALEKDISRGNGETLVGLSTVLGCSNASMLGRGLQQNYKEIFPSDQTPNEQVADSILEKVRQDPSLATQCSSLS